MFGDFLFLDHVSGDAVEFALLFLVDAGVGRLFLGAFLFVQDAHLFLVFSHESIDVAHE
jgi:hypothetical protein